ncbi:MAG: aldo/keto reductase [Oscillospiraceae bacterium]|nr:aldo/keto reductase [Oscillospiraceae bacterium]
MAQIKKNFGFGCMRLPMSGGEVDTVEFRRMVDLFLESGFNYFDTAHGYLNGKSELALRECLTSRYSRDRYILTNKLTNFFFQKEADIRPLDKAEMQAVEQVCGLMRSKNMIPCTACRYCTAGCPMNISIPDLFACFNAKNAFHDWNADYYYSNVHTVHNGKASACIKCGRCEAACPQHLPIRELLEKTAAEFERQ